MNSIWHNKDETPERSSRKIYWEYTGLDNSIGCGINPYWYPSHNTVRWCYLDDLLSQYDRIEKLEQELVEKDANLSRFISAGLDSVNRIERLESALDVAKQEYNQVLFGKYPYDMRESMEQKYADKIESILKGEKK